MSRGWGVFTVPWPLPLLPHFLSTWTLSREDCYNRFTVTGPVDSSVVLQPDLYYPFQHNKYSMCYPSYFSDSIQPNVRHCRDQSYPGSCYPGLLATPDLGPGELATAEIISWSFCQILALDMTRHPDSHHLNSCMDQMWEESDDWLIDLRVVVACSVVSSGIVECNVLGTRGRFLMGFVL